MQPLGNRVLVRDVEVTEKNVSGIIVQQFRDDRVRTAEVLAIGPGVVATGNGVLIPVDLELGDTIMYDSYGSTIEVYLEGEKLQLIPEEIVLLKE